MSNFLKSISARVQLPSTNIVPDILPLFAAESAHAMQNSESNRDELFVQANPPVEIIASKDENDPPASPSDSSIAEKPNSRFSRTKTTSDAAETSNAPPTDIAPESHEFEKVIKTTRATSLSEQATNERENSSILADSSIQSETSMFDGAQTEQPSLRVSKDQEKIQTSLPRQEGQFYQERVPHDFYDLEPGTVESVEKASNQSFQNSNSALARARSTSQNSIKMANLPFVRSQSAKAEPTVHISIGRVEVRAIMNKEAPPKRRVKRESKPKLSLDEYLSQRNRGRV